VNFALGADDFGSLTISGQHICTYDNIAAAGGCDGTFNMAPGVWYSIAIDYKNRAGSDGMDLTWDQPAGEASIGYGFVGALPLLVSKLDLRTLDLTGLTYTSGLRGDYYDLSGVFQSTVIGEGPLDAIGTTYNNRVVGSWNGYGYFSLFEERLTGQISLSPTATAPEPSPWVLLAIGLGMLTLAGGACSRRRDDRISAARVDAPNRPDRHGKDYRTTLTAVAATLATGLVINPSPAAAQASLKQANGPTGLVILNEHSGIITFCAAQTSINSLSSPPFVEITPQGKCGAIGGLPTTSLSGNGFVSVSFNSAINAVVNGVSLPWGVAFVGNLTTGFIVQCTYQYSPSSGQISGKCAPVATAVP
jgi:hypothetical protein